MPEMTSAREQMQDMKSAILTLLPAIKALELTLQTTDKEALDRQKEMAQSLDRVATALDTLANQQANLQSSLNRQQNETTSLTITIKALDERLTEEAQHREAMQNDLTRLLQLLQGPV